MQYKLARLYQRSRWCCLVLNPAVTTKAQPFALTFRPTAGAGFMSSLSGAGGGSAGTAPVDTGLALKFGSFSISTPPNGAGSIHHASFLCPPPLFSAHSHAGAQQGGEADETPPVQAHPVAPMSYMPGQPSARYH